MTMFSSIGSSRNVLLTSSGRDEWRAGFAIASSMYDDAVVCTHNNNSQKFHRSPHKLRLDENRVVYSFCDLHTIPEDEPVCEYRQVLLDKRLEREAFGSGSSLTSCSSEEVSATSSSDSIISTVSTDGERSGAESEIKGNIYDALSSQQFHAALFQTLRNERLERERQQNVVKGDTDALSSEQFHENLVDERLERKGKQRNRALNSEQFQAILFQVVRDEHEGKQNNVKGDTPAECNISLLQ